MPDVVNATPRRKMLPYGSDDNFRHLGAPAEFTQREREAPRRVLQALSFKSERFEYSPLLGHFLNL